MNSGNIFLRIFWNYIYSGREWTPVQSRQVSFVNGFSIIGISALVGFGIYRILIGEYIPGAVETTLGVIGIINIWYLRKSFDADKASAVLLSAMVVMITFLFVDGGIAGTGLYWAFTFPVLTFFLYDDEIGLRWNLWLVGILSIISLAKAFGLVITPYDWVTIRQAFFSFSAVVGLLYFYTKFTGVNARILDEKTKEIEEKFKKQKEKIELTAQNAQRALKEKIDIFFEISEDLMCLASIEGYFLEINPAFTNTLGYNQDELLHSPYIDLVHPEDKENTLQAMEKLAEGKSIENFTNRYKRKDGSYTYLLWNATPHNGIVYATARPIDSMIETKEKLQTRLTEFEKLNRLMVDRELAMIEMKKELATIKAEIQAKP